MPSEHECFVYIQLPEALEMVTCGRFTQRVDRTGVVTGEFVYGQSYRSRPDAVPIDPIHLPIARTAYQTAALGGIFGALRDASPDAWGRRIIDRQLERTDLTEVDYLLYSPEDRAGALSFGRGPTPPAPRWEFNRIVQLAELRAAARALEDDPHGETLPAPVRDLVRPGTSIGGARPKAVVEDDDGLWIAKFPQKNDRWNNAAVEAAMLALARRCRIQTPPTRIEPLGDEDILLVKRFDRERVEGGYRRHRMVSALTALNAEEALTMRHRWSYLLLSDEVLRWSHRHRADQEELFRRMVLNALVSNLDDHPRNHAMIARGTEWHLAPAYDITPDPLPGRHDRELAMDCGLRGRLARRWNLVSGAARFYLTEHQANAIIDEMKGIVAREWEGEVRRHGGTPAECERIAPAFVDEGLEYAAADAVAAGRASA